MVIENNWHSSSPETHIAGVTRCQRLMKETVTELTEYKYDMEAERSKLGYTDPSK